MTNDTLYEKTFESRDRRGHLVWKENAFSKHNHPMVLRSLLDEGVQLTSLLEASRNADNEPQYFGSGLGKELSAV